MATNPQLRAEIREFLVSRRARITPEQAGSRLRQGQHLLLYAAEPGSRSHEALKILASWTAPAQDPGFSLTDPSHTSTDSTGLG
jgi:hypothetical protein